MTEEEKEAIKYLEFLSNEKCECEACQHAKKEYKTISNLIKKQQKEIEEKRIIIFAGAEKVKQLEKGNRSLMESRIKWKDRYYKQLKELKEYNKQGQRLSNIMNSKDSYMYKSVCKNFVPKDKIREKIKKAKEIKWHTPKLVIEYFEELLEEN